MEKTNGKITVNQHLRGRQPHAASALRAAGQAVSTGALTLQEQTPSKGREDRPLRLQNKTLLSPGAHTANL